MAYNDGKKTFVVGTGGVEDKRLVKLSSGTIVHNTAASTDDPIGVTDKYGDAGDLAPVNLINKQGTLEITAAGAISSGADVYAAAAGKIQALPTAAGTYRKIGIALAAASGDGAIIEVLPYDYQATETVSE